MKFLICFLQIHSFMITPIEIMNNYKNWYVQNIRLYEEVLTECGKVFEVHVPAFNKNGEGLSFYIACQKGKIIVSDSGFIISNLKLGGFSWSESKIETVKSIINQYNLNYDESDSEIFFEVEENNFTEFNRKFQNLIYAVLAIDSLQLVISTKNILKLFVDEVCNKFSEFKIDFRTKSEAKIKGEYKTHIFQIFLPPLKNLPPVYISISNKINEDKLLLERFDLKSNIFIHNIYQEEVKFSPGITELFKKDNIKKISRTYLNRTECFMELYGDRILDEKKVPSHF